MKLPEHAPRRTQFGIPRRMVTVCTIGSSFWPRRFVCGLRASRLTSSSTIIEIRERWDHRPAPLARISLTSRMTPYPAARGTTGERRGRWGPIGPRFFVFCSHVWPRGGCLLKICRQARELCSNLIVRRVVDCVVQSGHFLPETLFGTSSHARVRVSRRKARAENSRDRLNAVHWARCGSVKA